MTVSRRKILLGLLALAGFLALAQAAYFFWAIRFPSALPSQCDLLVVFGGDPQRVQRGVQLASLVGAKAFVVSDTSAEDVAGELKSFGRPGNAEVLLEPRARHTVENAWYVSDIIRENGFRTVVLATSWYHIPRAGLLLRLSLIGQGVEVFTAPTDPVPDGWWKDGDFRHEQFKIWGALGQWMLGRRLTVRASNTQVRLNRLGRRLLRAPDRG